MSDLPRIFLTSLEATLCDDIVPRRINLIPTSENLLDQELAHLVLRRVYPFRYSTSLLCISLNCGEALHLISVSLCSPPSWSSLTTLPRRRPFLYFALLDISLPFLAPPRFAFQFFRPLLYFAGHETSWLPLDHEDTRDVVLPKRSFPLERSAPPGTRNSMLRDTALMRV